MSDGQNLGKRYGVLIASSQFPDEPKLQDLKCPENDVDGLSAMLNDAALGGFTDLVVIKNQPHHLVLRRIQQVLRKAGRDDLVLIFYAGHGKLDRAGRLYLATVDTVNEDLETTSVPATRIRELIENADTSKTALILDCCYSGAIEKSFLRGDVGEQLNIMARGRGTFIMTASTEVQTAREEVRDGFGLFTKHVIGGIAGGAADADGDGVITMNELYNYVHRQVLAESHQEPMKWDLNVRGELVVARTSRKPREERRGAIRERLFALADEGLIPDIVLTKALEVSNLSFTETRQGAASRYDALLDRVLEDDLRVGRFVNDWLQVPTDEVPRPEPKQQPEPAQEPEPKREPDAPPARSDVGLLWKLLVWPYPATQENVKHHPFYRLFHRADVRARERLRPGLGEKPVMTKSDVIILAAWWIAGFPFMIMMALIFSDNQSGGITGAIVWAALGLRLWSRARSRRHRWATGFYWLGIGACLVFVVVIINV